MYKTPDGVSRKAMGTLTLICDGMHSNLRRKVTDHKFRNTAHMLAMTLTGFKGGSHKLCVLCSVGQPVFSLYPISSTEVGTLLVHACCM